MIRSKLNGARLVIELLSRSFYESPFCLNEMGAVWSQAKPMLPLLIPPMKHDDLNGVMTKAVQTPVLGSLQSGSELRKYVRAATGREALSGWPVAWNTFVARLDDLLQTIEMRRRGKTQDLFISAPMSSIAKKEYRRVRELAMAVGAELAGARGYYFAGRDCPTRKQFDERSVAVRKDVARLKGSLAYVLLLPVETLKQSSIHFEAGIALADDTTRGAFLFRKDLRLPFMMQEASARFSHLRSISFVDPDDLLKKLENPNNKVAIFPGRRKLLDLEDGRDG